MLKISIWRFLPLILGVFTWICPTSAWAIYELQLDHAVKASDEVVKRVLETSLPKVLAEGRKKGIVTAKEEKLFHDLLERAKKNNSMPTYQAHVSPSNDDLGIIVWGIRDDESAGKPYTMTGYLEWELGRSTVKVTAPGAVGRSAETMEIDAFKGEVKIVGHTRWKGFKTVTNRKLLTVGPARILENVTIESDRPIDTIDRRTYDWGTEVERTRTGRRGWPKETTTRRVNGALWAQRGVIRTLPVRDDKTAPAREDGQPTHSNGFTLIRKTPAFLVRSAGKIPQKRPSR